LLELARRLGSDVPFFIRGGTALGSGRGDELIPLPTPSGQWAVLLIPQGLPDPQKTSRLYGLLKHIHFPSEPTSTIDVARKIRAGEKFTPEMFNTFDQVAVDAHFGHLRSWEALRNLGAENVLLAGAGPTLFTLVNTRNLAQDLARRLSDQGYYALAVPFLAARNIDGLSQCD